VPSRFGLFEFDDQGRVLRKQGRLVRLEPQPARALALLLARPGALVTREELRRALWEPGVHVDFERGLAYAIAQVRAALGDTADNPRFVETVPRQGYRFIAPVQSGPSPSNRPAELSSSAGTSESSSAARASAVPVGTSGDTPWSAGTSVPASPPRATRWPVALLFTIVAAAVGWSAWQAWHPVRPIVAVAIFDNETGRADLDALAATAADVMVARLTALGVETLGVIGNTPRLRQPRAERDPRAVREETGAGYLVFGQLQPDDAGVRLVVHLIRLDDQTHLWVTRVPRPTARLDGIQEAVAERLAEAVRAHVIERNPRAPRFTR
jgi:DNA-binding winged helix-turn-helix (wHTH) protein/TolB-like protein